MKRSLIASLLSVAHRRPLEFVIKSGADPLSFQVFVHSIRRIQSAVVGVTECHADDGRRIADRYSQRQRPVWLSRSPAAVVAFNAQILRRVKLGH